MLVIYSNVLLQTSIILCKLRAETIKREPKINENCWEKGIGIVIQEKIYEEKRNEEKRREEKRNQRE